MICKVKQTIDNLGLINVRTKTVSVALSGGADSACLLDILVKLKDEYGIIVKAVHVNHNIRGDEAKNDEQFVRDLCKKMGVELEVFSVDVPKLAKERKLSLEECGRQARYDCFREIDCDVIATAHTLSDSIETMLFNLARGTGAKGLTGINATRLPNIIRPLVECTRSEIEDYCFRCSLDFVTDSTNLSDDYTRNHIRHNIVPEFKKINTDFEKSFLRAMKSVDEVDAYVDASADLLLSEAKTEKGYDLLVFRSKDKAVIKRAILKLLKPEMQKPPEAKHIESVYLLIIDGKGKIEIAKDLYVVADSDIIFFSRADKEADRWSSYFSGGVAASPYASYRLAETYDFTPDSFDAEKINGELMLSSRLPGDKFTLNKRYITKSLKKLFNELKIPLNERNKVAVLRDGKNIVWVENIGVNSMYIPDANTQKILTIKKDG